MEQEVSSILNTELNFDGYVDDVLVFGQHLRTVHKLIYLVDVNRLVTINKRDLKVRTRAYNRMIGAKALYYATLSRFDDIEAVNCTRDNDCYENT